ncbi:hypothetical protein CTAYLR_001271 [Chrysophaeum taylorii]|uniref:Uncharacterized protein n=1 Tax=Chrysophaeum taylorii TaxID=2483200 RepID=A0AAD7XK65_9STRA|nr:hypothetical protein CTAYLR_001271 [Chrysophaeum taylorii]
MEDDDEDEVARVRTDLALFRDGIIKPFATHQVLDTKLYATNQAKQTRYTEHALLSAGTCGAAHESATKIIHKGDTKPLLFARSDAAKEAARTGRQNDDRTSRLVRAAEAKKRTGDAFFEAAQFPAALATYAQARRMIDELDTPTTLALRLKLRLASSDAALKSGDAARAEAEAEAALMLAPSDESRLRRAIARLVGRKYNLAADDLVACEPSPVVEAVKRKLLAKAPEIPEGRLDTEPKKASPTPDGGWVEEKRDGWVE